MQSRKIAKFSLSDKAAVFVLIWSVGLSLGIFWGTALRQPLSAFLRSSCFSESTYIIPAAILPITLVWIVSRHKLQGLIFLIIFCKAFLDGLVLPGIGAAFGSASWLMGFLVFFADRIATLFLIYFSLKCLLDRDCCVNHWYVVFLLLIVVVITVDYLYISRNLIYLMP